MQKNIYRMYAYISLFSIKSSGSFYLKAATIANVAMAICSW